MSRHAHADPVEKRRRTGSNSRTRRRDRDGPVTMTDDRSPVLTLQRSLGNQAVQGLFRRDSRVNGPDDSLERKATRTARTATDYGPAGDRSDGGRQRDIRASRFAPQSDASRAPEEPRAGRVPVRARPGPRSDVHRSDSRLTLQRQVHSEPAVSVRSPVFEETVTQASAFAGANTGRSLTSAEVDLARSVFGASLDYDRVRIVPIEISALEYRTVGNVIYAPPDFTIGNESMAETFVHELTHVWQYQHGGTRYISVSLTRQFGAAVSSGSRNVAYDYRITPGDSFFDFAPEQQGLIVQNYFAMLRDRATIARNPPPGRGFRSNHMTASGEWVTLSAADRLTEITRELPLHEPLMRQLRAAVPRTELDLLQQRASEVMLESGREQVPEERRLTPLKPVLEVRF